MRKCIFFLILIPLASFSQKYDSLLMTTLDEVILSDIRNDKGLPWSYKKDSVTFSDTYQNSVRNLFDRQTGIQSFNGENFAQDVRLSIRGFGSRSAFGIRGIRIFQDGIPLTSPDGTSQLDELSIFDIQEIDIVRSGLSARLGNASGGAISMKSTGYKNGITFNTRVNTFGSFDAGLKYGSAKGNVENILSINHHTFHSKREYAGSQNNTIYNKTRFIVRNRWQLDFINSIYYSPEGKDPGALTAAEFMTNKYQANTRNILFKSGESVGGLLTAVKSIYSSSEKATWITALFYRKRVFEGLLPFDAGGWVNLNRDFVGFNNVYEYRRNKNNIITLGQSAEYQDDRRSLFRNQNSNQGSKTADQNESVTNLALYQQWQLNLSKFSFHQLIRYDYNLYRLTDRYLTDGNQDGQKNYNSLNGALGIAYHLSNKTMIYSNISTSFEMPALNELTNNPANTPGFNVLLNPEKSIQTELGVKISPSENVEFSTSAYLISLKDQIQGYELPATPGRTYYRNATSGSRFGLELSFRSKLTSWSQISINYTYADYRYTSFKVSNIDFSGNRQPLIPAHKLNVSVSTHFDNWINMSFFYGYNHKMFLDDANLTHSDSFSEINAVVSSGPELSKNMTIGIQCNNFLNLMKYSNFRPNAAAQRFYEAASPMHFGLFLKVELL